MQSAARASAAPFAALLWTAGTLLLFAFIALSGSLTLGFIGDDYVFLDRTLNSGFGDLWSRRHTDFGWFRPWSRDFHFWAVGHATHLSPTAFRLANLALWLATLLVYFRLVAAHAPWPSAPIATFGVAALTLWGTPLLWISGSQDLWMLLFSLSAIALDARGRHLLAAVAVGFALLSKETAGVVPLVLMARAIAVERTSAWRALRRALPSLLVTALWAFMHPTLLPRLLGRDPGDVAEAAARPAAPLVVLRALAANLNLDMLPRPDDPAAVVFVAASTAAVLVFGLARVLHLRPAAPGSGIAAMRFGIAWAVLGTLPALSPGIGWHAYYGSLAAFGAWLALGTLLARRLSVAMVVIGALAVLRAAAAATPSWDWGAVWYQRRAASIVSAVRVEVMSRYPDVPPHTRIFFGRIPNNVGLVAGSSPAVRVWYRDPSLSSGFYSSYRPRSSNEAAGQDLFFRFDTLRTLIEVGRDVADVDSALRDNADWVDDHEKLALLFLRTGDHRAAARTFELLARAPGRVDALLLAGVCLRAAGDSLSARRLFAQAGAALAKTPGEIATLASELEATMPVAAR